MDKKYLLLVSSFAVLSSEIPANMSLVNQYSATDEEDLATMIAAQHKNFLTTEENSIDEKVNAKLIGLTSAQKIEIRTEIHARLSENSNFLFMLMQQAQTGGSPDTFKAVINLMLENITDEIKYMYASNQTHSDVKNAVKDTVKKHAATASSGTSVSTPTSPTNQDKSLVGTDVSSLTYDGRPLSIFQNLQEVFFTVKDISAHQSYPRKIDVNINGTSKKLPLSSLSMPIGTLSLEKVSKLESVDISNLTVDKALIPDSVTYFTASDKLLLLGKSSGLKNVKVVGSSKTLPTWLLAGAEAFGSGDISLDLSSMQGLRGHLDLAGLDAAFSSIILPSMIDSATLPSGIKNLTVGTSVKEITSEVGLSTITLTGSGSVLPAWALDGTLAAQGATLDLSSVSGVGENISLNTLSSKYTSIALPLSVTNTVTLPSSIRSLAANSKLTTIMGTSGLTSIKPIGNDPTIPAWAQDGTKLSSGATLDLSQMTGLGASADLTSVSSAIANIIVPPNASSVTLNPSLTSVSAASSSLTSVSNVSLVGSLTSVPTWLKPGKDFMLPGATVDLTGMTSLSVVDLSNINSNIGNVILPALTTTLIAPVSLPALNYSSAAGLSSITLTGNGTSLPNWATTWTTVAPNSNLNLSELSGNSTLDLTNLSAAITSVQLPYLVSSLRIPSTVTTLSGATQISNLILTGAGTTTPSWLVGGSLTSVATLDLSNMTSLTTVDLSTAGNEIVNVILPISATSVSLSSSVVSVKGSSSVNSLKVYGTTPILPSWARSPLFMTNNSTLDLTNMTGFAVNTALNLSGLYNVTNVKLPNTISSVVGLPSTVTSLTASYTAATAEIAKGYVKNVVFLDNPILSGNPITSIPDNFLLGSGIISADFSSLVDLTTIGANFMKGCTSLTTVKLNNLTSVSSVGSDMFLGCTRLRASLVDTTDSSGTLSSAVSSAGLAS